MQTPSFLLDSRVSRDACEHLCGAEAPGGQVGHGASALHFLVSGERKASTRYKVDTTVARGHIGHGASTHLHIVGERKADTRYKANTEHNEAKSERKGEQWTSAFILPGARRPDEWYLYRCHQRYSPMTPTSINATHWTSMAMPYLEMAFLPSTVLRSPWLCAALLWCVLRLPRLRLARGVIDKPMAAP